MKQQINQSIASAISKVDEIYLFTEMANYLNRGKTKSRFVKSVHAHASPCATAGGGRRGSVRAGGAASPNQGVNLTR